MYTEACAALSGFQPTLVGGDGNAVQICTCLLTQTPCILTPLKKVFVGYWPDKNSVVVAHEGTDPTKL